MNPTSINQGIVNRLKEFKRNQILDLPIVDDDFLSGLNPIKTEEWMKRNNNLNRFVLYGTSKLAIGLDGTIGTNYATTLPDHLFTGIKKVTVDSVNKEHQEIDLFTVKDYLVLYSYIYNDSETPKKHKINHRDSKYDLPLMLLPFFVYSRKFASTYMSYMDDPDIQVKFSTKFDSESNFLDFYDVTPAMSSIRLRTLCHLILLLLDKNINVNSVDLHKENFIKKRMGACFATLGSHLKELPWVNDQIIGYSDQLKYLPKLKKALYEFCILNMNDYSELKLCMSLSAYKLMNSAALISKMVKGDEKVLLFIHGTFCADLKRFIETINKLKEQYGEDTWVYHKMLYPEDTTYTATQFGNLTNAAKHYFLGIDPENSIKNYTPPGSTTIPNLKYLAQTPLPATLTKADIISLDNFKMVSDELGLNFPEIERLFKENQLDLMVKQPRTMHTMPDMSKFQFQMPQMSHMHPNYYPYAMPNFGMFPQPSAPSQMP